MVREICLLLEARGLHYDVAINCLLAPHHPPHHQPPPFLCENWRSEIAKSKVALFNNFTNTFKNSLALSLFTPSFLLS